MGRSQDPRGVLEKIDGEIVAHAKDRVVAEAKAAVRAAGASKGLTEAVEHLRKVERGRR